MSLTPFEQGEIAAIRGEAGMRRKPGPDSSWAERLWNRGWESGMSKLAQSKQGDFRDRPMESQQEYFGTDGTK